MSITAKFVPADFPDCEDDETQFWEGSDQLCVVVQHAARGSHFANQYGNDPAGRFYSRHCGQFGSRARAHAEALAVVARMRAAGLSLLMPAA